MAKKHLPSLRQLTTKPPAGDGAVSIASLPSLAALGVQGGRLPTLKELTSEKPATGGGGSPSHRGGVLGFLGHEVAQTGSDLYHSAVNAPGGAIQAGKAAVSDVEHLPRRIVENLTGGKPSAKPWQGQQGHATKLLPKTSAEAAAYKQQLEQEAAHPLRHPGNTLLDFGALIDAGVGGGFRAASAAGTIREGGSLGDALRAAAAPVDHGSRTLRVGDLEVHPETSRGHIGAAAQKASDQLLQRAADRNPAGLGASIVNRKVGKRLTAEAQASERIARGPGQALIALGKKLKPAEQKALQVVAEQAPLADRITAASARVVGAKDAAARARFQGELDLLHQAQRHLTAADGKPALADARLRKVYDKMATVAGDRETLLKGLGQLTDEAIQSRNEKAARVASGQPISAEQAGSLASDERAAREAEAAAGTAEGGPEAAGREASGVAPVSGRQVAHWPTGEDIAALSHEAVANHQGFRDRKLIDSAIGATRNAHGYQGGDLFDAAANLINNVQRQQALVDGNKRLGLASGMLLLEKNGVDTAKLGESDRLGKLVRAVATGRSSAGQLASFMRAHAEADLFTPGRDAVRIPDVATKARGLKGGVTGRVGSQGTIGHLKKPGSLSHEYTGALREAGLTRNDTTTLVGESSIEAAKYAGLRHIHDLVRQAAASTPTRPDDIAVRLDNLKGHERLPLDVRKFVDDPSEFFKTASEHEQASMVDKVREQLFIDPRKLDPQAKAEFAKLNEQGKIGWVPRRILGDLAKPQAPLSAVVGSKPVRTVDAINNASRFAILYLKPAYAIPNLLGNAALTALQQGFAAVPNLARAARLNAKLGDEVAARVDAAMGEGFAQSVSAHGQGRLAGAVDKAARLWSKGVDTPFRRSAFLYEAHRAGFKTPGEITSLVTDPKLHGKLVDLSIRANREIIDYSNLTPLEREVVRRVVFFYPWVKGSTVYAGRLLREHPVKAAVSGHLGERGKQVSDETFGPVPSYLEGIVPWAGGSEVVNPNSAAILQTPAVLGSTLAGLATGNIPEVAQAANYYTPALALAAAELSRTNPQTGQAFKPGTSGLSIARQTLAGGLPQVSLVRNLKAALTGEGGSKLYPPSVRSALLQFLVGGVAPRRIDRQDLARLAELERRQMRSGR